MEASYNDNKGLYVASGYFDPDNTSYVPGTIVVEYKTKTEDIVVSENYDLSNVLKIADVKDTLNVTYTKNNDKELEAVIDMSDVVGDIGKGEIKAAIKYIDKKTGSSLDDIKDIIGIGEKAYKYFLPGENNENYVMDIDFWSDPDKIIMLMYDTGDAGLTVAKQIVSMELDFSAFGSKGYEELFDLSEKLGNASKVLGFAYNTYGIYKDYNDLIKEIDKSSTISDKSLAKKKALELRQDQMAFLAVTTILPLLVAGSTMAAPALVFSGLIAAMTGVSGFFWDSRTANAKEQSFKLKWVIDPSGYVYDSISNARIEDATVTAYWIPCDDSDGFWEKKPDNNQYGTEWDATEYEQINPMQTNAEGKYAWDVPEGWWRVKCEKDGYETYWSEWMTVPPVQTEVNIGLVKIDNNKTEPTEPPVSTPTNPPIHTPTNSPTFVPDTHPNNNIISDNNPNNEINITNDVKETKIKLAAPKIKTIKLQKNKKSVTLKLKKKIKGAQGYQIQYATNKKFKAKKAKYIGKTSGKIKGLKKNKKYYFRVRAYIMKGNKKVYGKWSKVKMVKTNV